MNRLLRVGEVVKVREDLKVDFIYGGAHFPFELKGFLGKWVTISSVEENFLGETFYKIFEDENYWCWTFEMFNVSQTHLTTNFNVSLKNYLPSKVIFVIEKGRTTLLFGDKPNYEVYRSEVTHGDTFDKEYGFWIALTKKLLNGVYEDKKELWNFLYDDDYQQHIDKMQYESTIILKDKAKLSLNQIRKLYSWTFRNPIKFVVGSEEHTIDVEITGGTKDVK